MTEVRLVKRYGRQTTPNHIKNLPINVSSLLFCFLAQHRPYIYVPCNCNAFLLPIICWIMIYSMYFHYAWSTYKSFAILPFHSWRWFNGSERFHVNIYIHFHQVLTRSLGSVFTTPRKLKINLLPSKSNRHFQKLPSKIACIIICYICY